MVVLQFHAASLCPPGVPAGRCSQIKHHYRPWKQHGDDDDDDDDHGDNDGDDGGEAIVRWNHLSLGVTFNIRVGCSVSFKLSVN